jgi:hypothetical protein
MEYFYLIISTFSTYKIWSFLTHPNSKVWNKFPRIKNKRVEVFPSIKINIRGRTIHLHHWFNCSLLLCMSVFVSGGILDTWVIRSILLGGIIQGYSIPSARKLVYKSK